MSCYRGDSMARNVNRNMNWLAQPEQAFGDPFGKVIDLLNAPVSFREPFLFDREDLWTYPMPIDLSEDGNKLVLKADIPGVKKEDIKVDVQGNRVAIRASANREMDRKGKNYYYSERGSASYYREIALPQKVNAKSVKAKYENGTLELVMEADEEGKSQIRIE